MIVDEKVLEILKINYHLKGGKKVLITDRDYNAFSEEVAKNTGTTAKNCNTWKRVFRHLKKKDGQPFESGRETCQIILQYLGYESWDELKEDLDNDYEWWQKKMGNNNVSGIQPVTPIDLIIKKLQKGDIIEVKYVPDRVVLLKFIKKDYYEVVSSKNSSLRQGDKVFISMFAIGYPLMVSDIIRNGESKGKYQSARGHDIQSVNLYKENSKYDFE